MSDRRRRWLIAEIERWGREIYDEVKTLASEMIAWIKRFIPLVVIDKLSWNHSKKSSYSKWNQLTKPISGFTDGPAPIFTDFPTNAGSTAVLSVAKNGNLALQDPGFPVQIFDGIRELHPQHLGCDTKRRRCRCACAHKASHNGRMTPSLDELTSALRDAGARFAYVFGSRARGTATESSDLDLAAFFGRDDVDPLSVRGIDFDSVDLVVLDRAPLELAGRAAMHGRLLFETDPAERVAWEALTRKIFLDELPRMEQARKDFVAGARARAAAHRG